MKINFVIVTFLLLTGWASAQSIRWVELHESEKLSLTNSDEQLYCFGLEYTPVMQGVLKSYNADFFLSCQDQNSPVVHNRSISFRDNSSIVDGCHEENKILLHASALTGHYGEHLTPRKSVILHQICISLKHDEPIHIEADEAMGVLIEILTSNGEVIFEKPVCTSVSLLTAFSNKPIDSKL